MKAKFCECCHKPCYAYSKNYCWDCWSSRPELRQKPPVVCVSCGERRRHYARHMCKGCYSKAYQREHLSKHAAYERKRRKVKREHVNSLDRLRQNKPKRKEWRAKYQREYYAKHRESLLEYQRNYRRSDLQRQANYKRRRRARVANLPDTLTIAEWNQLLKEHKHRCAYCGAKNVYLEREHKIPASLGGGFTKDNIVPACGRCNRRKKTMTDSQFREYIKKYP